jgi:hypothetical protein
VMTERAELSALLGMPIEAIAGERADDNCGVHQVHQHLPPGPSTARAAADRKVYTRPDPASERTGIAVRSTGSQRGSRSSTCL